MTEEESGEMAMVLERQESIEKQQVYEDAFLEQMENYIRYGELERMFCKHIFLSAFLYEIFIIILFLIFCSSQRSE